MKPRACVLETVNLNDISVHNLCLRSSVFPKTSGVRPNTYPEDVFTCVGWHQVRDLCMRSRAFALQESFKNAQVPDLFVVCKCVGVFLRCQKDSRMPKECQSTPLIDAGTCFRGTKRFPKHQEGFKKAYVSDLYVCLCVLEAPRRREGTSFIKKGSRARLIRI